MLRPGAPLRIRGDLTRGGVELELRTAMGFVVLRRELHGAIDFVTTLPPGAYEATIVDFTGARSQRPVQPGSEGGLLTLP